MNETRKELGEGVGTEEKEVRRKRELRMDPKAVQGNNHTGCFLLLPNSVELMGLDIPK